MSLIALAVKAEVAFVAAHHIVRIFVVMVAAAPSTPSSPICAAARRAPAQAPAGLPPSDRDRRELLHTFSRKAGDHAHGFARNRV